MEAEEYVFQRLGWLDQRFVGAVIFHILDQLGCLIAEFTCCFPKPLCLINGQRSIGNRRRNFRRQPFGCIAKFCK